MHPPQITSWDKPSQAAPPCHAGELILGAIQLMLCLANGSSGWDHASRIQGRYTPLLLACCTPEKIFKCVKVLEKR